MCYIQHSRWRCPRCGQKSNADTVELIICGIGPHDPTWINSTGRTSVGDCETCLNDPVNAGPPVVLPDSPSWLSDPMYYEEPWTPLTPEATSAGPGTTVYCTWDGTVIEAGDDDVEPTGEAASGATTLENAEEFTGRESQVRERIRTLLENEELDKVLVFATEQDQYTWIQTRLELLESLRTPRLSDASYQKLCEFESYLIRLYEEGRYNQILNEFLTKALAADFVIQYTDGRREVWSVNSLENALYAIGNCRQGEVAWFKWGYERFAPIGPGPEDGNGADHEDHTNDDGAGVESDEQAQDEFAIYPESDIYI